MSQLNCKPKLASLSWQSFMLLISSLAALLSCNNKIRCQQLQLFHQHNNNLHFEVVENSPNNTYIGNIRSADNQIPKIIVPSQQTPEYERLQAFRYDLNTGSLYTNSVLDREHREIYHFVAIVQEPFAEIKCTVTVRDLNDNAPMFLLAGSTILNPQQVAAGANNNDTAFVIEVPENQRGVRRLLPLAIDLDSPLTNGIKEFKIVSPFGNTPSGTFHLVQHDAPVSSTLLPSLNQVLWADENSAGAASSQSAFENPRIQEQLNAVVLVPSQPSQANLLHTHSSSSSSSSSSAAAAAAAAAAANSPSSSIAGSPHISRFLIDLEVNQTLDRETQSTYHLIIEAIDGGQPPLIGKLLVTVNVQDVNDNDPIFSKKIYEFYVQENASKGTIISRLQATDADLDANAKISYYIARHYNATSHPFASNNHQNYTSQQLQRSNRNGQQQQQQQQQQQFPISSNQAAQVNPADWFEIDSEKGEIFLLSQLDYEQIRMHEFMVEARDHGKPSRSSYAIVKVYVNDVNDDPPAAPVYSQQQQQQLGAAADTNFSATPGHSSTQISSSSRMVVDSYYYNSDASAANVGGGGSGGSSRQSSSLLISLVLLGLILVAFPICLVKFKSKKPPPMIQSEKLVSSHNQQTKIPNHTQQVVYEKPVFKTQCLAIPSRVVESTMNVPSQLVYTHDWCSSYNWDYLSDWTPEY